MAKPFIAIVARSKSGKSTITKSLTGCSTNSYRGFLEDRVTGEKILVICGSPQEQPIPVSELRELFKVASEDPYCRGVVIAIQPIWTRIRLSMESIFQEATNCGGFEMHAFIIDPAWNGDAANAEEIKARLSAFAVKIESLDGRRFATINARIINDATGVVPVGTGEIKKAASAGGKH